jgi:hypothetical protein
VVKLSVFYHDFHNIDHDLKPWLILQNKCHVNQPSHALVLEALSSKSRI